MHSRIPENNAPAQVVAVASAREPLPGREYAGAGIRLLAALIDTALLLAMIAAAFFGIRYGLAGHMSGRGPFVAAFAATQMLGIVVSAAYHILPLRRYGCTAGQALCGLRVVDRCGHYPEFATVLVRFSYHIIAALFLFPILGYAVALFRKTRQGPHDHLAGTFVVMKPSRLKNPAAWLLLVVLLAGAGRFIWQQRPNLRLLLNPLLPAVNIPEARVTLTPLWTRFVGNDRLINSSYIVRAEQCIMADSDGVRAFSLRDGALRWHAAPRRPITLQALSANPEFPLLALHYPDNDRVSLLRLDSDSGDVLWEQSLESHDLLVTFDAETALVYDSRFIRAYTADGVIQWEQRFEDTSTITYVVLNRDILLTRSRENEHTLNYLHRATGQVLWQEEASSYYAGQALGQGYQMLSSSDDRLTFFALPQARVLWEIPLDAGHIIDYEIDQNSGHPTTLYTSTAMLRATDGVTLFSYPENSRFGCIAPNFLFLLSYADSHELLLIETSTGHIVRRYPDTAWLTAEYLTEDDAGLYLVAHQPEGSAQEWQMMSLLIVLDKVSLELREYQIGTNLQGSQFRVFPDEQMMFITTNHHIGAYSFSEE